MQLLYLEQKKTDRLNRIFIYILSLILAAGVVYAYGSVFSIDFFPISFKSGLGGSIINAWNSIANCLGRSDYFLLDKYDGASSDTGFLFILLSFVLAVLNYFILKSKRTIFLLVYVMPLLVFMFIWDITPSISATVMFLSVLLLAYLFMLNKCSISINMILIYLLCLFLAITGSIMLENQLSSQKLSSVNKIGDSIDEGVYKFKYGSAGLLGGEDLSRIGDRKKDESEALTITMDDPDSLYLRGFIGSKYKDNSWTTLRNDVYYKNLELIRGLNASGFNGLTQLHESTELTNTELEKNNIKIKNTGTNRKYIYTPYELMTTDIEDTKNYADEFLASDKFMGSKEYSYESSKNLTKQWPSLVAQLFSMESNDQIAEYRILESHYNAMIYENYTELDDEASVIISKNLGYRGNQRKGHIEYKTAISSIKDYLEENVFYTERFSPVGEDDFVETFFEKKKGYDVHYASAATLMFRYYGIPARYVEGYLITPERAREGNSYTPMKISNENLHAWTEIYIDSFGWVPIEVTPEYYDVMDEPDMTKGLENISVPNPFDEKSKSSSNQEESEGESAKEKNFPWKVVLLILVGLIVFALLAYTVYKLIRYCLAAGRRRKSFNQADPKKAICAIYDAMLSIARESKSPSARKSKSIGENLRQIDGKSEEIGRRAAFSKYPMSEEERKYMLDALKILKKKKR